MSEVDERARRLAEALRANLKRRKAQARGEAAAGTVSEAQPTEHPITEAP